MRRRAVLRHAAVAWICAIVAGAPVAVRAQASGATIRAKVRLEATPRGSSVTIRQGRAVLRRATAPVSLVMTWAVEQPIQVVFAKSGYEECRRQIVIRWAGPTEGVVVQDTIRQTFPVGSMRTEDAPVVSCTLRRRGGGRE